jgi:hypothetical protein
MSLASSSHPPRRPHHESPIRAIALDVAGKLRERETRVRETLGIEEAGTQAAGDSGNTAQIRILLQVREIILSREYDRRDQSRANPILALR